MRYIIARKSLMHSEIRSENNTVLGVIDFKILDKHFAKLHTESGHNYGIESSSTFGFDFKLKEGNVTLDEIKVKIKWFSLYNSVTITTIIGTEYTINWSGFVNGKMSVLNKDNKEAAIISWKGIDIRNIKEWVLEISDSDSELNTEEMIMLISYCFIAGIGITP